MKNTEIYPTYPMKKRSLKGVFAGRGPAYGAGHGPCNRQRLWRRQRRPGHGQHLGYYPRLALQTDMNREGRRHAGPPCFVSRETSDFTVLSTIGVV